MILYISRSFYLYKLSCIEKLLNPESSQTTYHAQRFPSRSASPRLFRSSGFFLISIRVSFYMTVQFILLLPTVCDFVFIHGSIMTKRNVINANKIANIKYLCKMCEKDLTRNSLAIYSINMKI